METVHHAGTAAAIHIGGSVHCIFRPDCLPQGNSGIETLPMLLCPNIRDGQYVLLVLFVLRQSVQEEKDEEGLLRIRNCPRAIFGNIG